MLPKRIIQVIKQNPKKLFLMDGVGAVLSAILLGIVLVRLESFFGIPHSTLYFLASLPLLFTIYDFYCYQKDSINLNRSLKIIAIVNLMYCCLSIGLSFYHIETITGLGWVYILSEVMIIFLLAFFELKIAGKLMTIE